MSSSGNSTSAPPPSDNGVADQTRARREAYIKDANGNLVGNDFKVTKGNFARFLGFKPATPQELTGKTPISGDRVIELALQKEMQELGADSAKNGAVFNNVDASAGRFGDDPKHQKDMVNESMDALADSNQQSQQGGSGGQPNQEQHGGDKVHVSPGVQPYLDKFEKVQAKSRYDNKMYLVMQYKFQWLSTSVSTISNLLKTRSDAVSRTIRSGQ